MDEIRTLIKIARDYYYYDGKYYNERICIFDEGVDYYTYQNEDYDEHYRICYEAATNFINTINVFSEFKPEEIIKVFTGMVFKNNRVLVGVDEVWVRHRLNLYEELLKVNKEMLVALIKAINDKKIPPAKFHCFININGNLGARSSVYDHEKIRLYRILLEYNHFSLDNLNLGNLVNEIRPPMTKRAV